MIFTLCNPLDGEMVMEETVQVGAKSREIDPAAVAAELDAEIEATEIGDVRELSFSVPEAADMVLEHAPGIRALRGAFEAAFNRFDLRNIDEIERRAIAAKFVYNAEQVALSAPDDGAAQKALARGAEVRGILEAACEYNAKLGVPLGEGLAKARRLKRGYRATSNALQQLERLLASQWASVAPTMPHGEALLSEARTLSVKLSGYRDPESDEEDGVDESQPHPLTVKRRKAARLLWIAYDACRAGLSYVRWTQKDMDQIAPSLSTAVSRRTKSDESAAGDAENKAGDAKPVNPGSPVKPLIPVDSGAAQGGAGTGTKGGGAVEQLPDSPFKK